MNIGEQIKYLRKRRHITQEQLAQVTGIHPVTIRKYETNKLQPKKEQINKIASALLVSPLAFGEFDSNKLSLKTTGDLMGLLIMLYKSGVIGITGRREKNGGIKPETAQFAFSDILNNYFSIEGKKGSQDLSNIRLELLDQEMLSYFVKWANLYSNHKVLEDKYANTDSDVEREYMQGNEDQMAMLELELMAFTDPLSNFD